MKFVDRVEELNSLEKEYAKDASSLVVIYGRRRTGKTTLINEFIKDKNALYFLASEERESLVISAFQEKVADFTGNSLLNDVDVKNWDTLFKSISITPFAEKPIIVIDEFQYLGKSNPAFPSIFQRIWDEILKDSNVMVIICGSLISMMFSQTLAYNSPLYGRRTAQIKLDQIPFAYYNEFFPDKSYQELIESYAVTGGVPKYIESFEHASDIFKGISENILSRNSYLYNEPNFLLQQEVTEIGTYFSLIRVIATGNHKLSAISSTLGIKATSLTKYLKVLIELDIIEKRVPITEKNPERSKKGLYFVKDNFLKFWFAFVHPNMSFLESGHREIVEEKIKKNFIDNHAAFIYKEICRSQMWEMNANGSWPFHFTKVGSYWDNALEIDIAACDFEYENYIFGECKYRKELMDPSVLMSLEAKISKLPKDITNKKIWFVLFSISGFTPKLIDIAKNRDDIILASQPLPKDQT